MDEPVPVDERHELVDDEGLHERDVGLVDVDLDVEAGLASRLGDHLEDVGDGGAPLGTGQVQPVPDLRREVPVEEQRTPDGGGDDVELPVDRELRDDGPVLADGPLHPALGDQELEEAELLDQGVLGGERRPLGIQPLVGLAVPDHLIRDDDLRRGRGLLAVVPVGEAAQEEHPAHDTGLVDGALVILQCVGGDHEVLAEKGGLGHQAPDVEDVEVHHVPLALDHDLDLLAVFCGGSH